MRVFLLAVIVGSLGCNFSSMGPLRERASFDFKCPKEQLALTELPNSQVGVEGCGNRGVYVDTPAGWVMNTESSKNPK